MSKRADKPLKSAVLRVRMRASDLARIDAAAAASHLDPVTWARSTLLRVANGESHPGVTPEPMPTTVYRFPIDWHQRVAFGNTVIITNILHVAMRNCRFVYPRGRWRIVGLTIGGEETPHDLVRTIPARVEVTLTARYLGRKRGGERFACSFVGDCEPDEIAAAASVQP